MNKFKIILTGYGGEISIGTVDRKIYDYFLENEIDLEEWVTDWDNEAEVPDEYFPFEPGSWYDCDDIAHESGVELSESCTITVEVDGESYWKSSLDATELSEKGVVVSERSEAYISEQPEGTVVCYGMQGEKGLFFAGEVESAEPFDPKKLAIGYDDIDGWCLITSVEYDGEPVESWDYDTVGKSLEIGWRCIGEEND